MPLTAYRFTVDDYHRMAEVGILREDDRVELLDGQIVALSPIGPRHAATVARIQELFTRLAGARTTVWGQNPVRLNRYAEPQPDVALLAPRRDFYAAAVPAPEDVLLLVEVADSSLRYDREQKIPAYAAAGIGEVWLVDLNAETIEVLRQPREGRYASVRTARRGETVTPRALPDLALAVELILG
jgi:Uma2 family endonuclease